MNCYLEAKLALVTAQLHILRRNVSEYVPRVRVITPAHVCVWANQRPRYL